MSHKYQQSLFDPYGSMPPAPTLPFARKSGTSKAAAAAMRSRAPSQAAMIVDFVASHPMATREQVAAGLRIKEASVCGRVNWLISNGFIYEADTCGVTTSGHSAARLKITGKPFPDNTAILLSNGVDDHAKSV